MKSLLKKTPINLKHIFVPILLAIPIFYVLDVIIPTETPWWLIGVGITMANFILKLLLGEQKGDKNNED